MALTRPRIGQFSTTVSSLSDPLTVLHAGSTVADSDIGFVMNRANGLISNVALYWNEAGNTFVTAFTTTSGVINSNISPTAYANLTVGTLTANTLSVAGGGINGVTIGAVTPAAGTFTNLTLTGNVTSDLKVNGNLTVDGTVTFKNTVVETSTELVQGIEVVAGNLVANSGTTSTSITTGALVVKGGAGISGNLFVGDSNSLHNIQGNLLIGKGSVQQSADSILTINLNTDTPLYSHAAVQIVGETGKSAILSLDSVGTGITGQFNARRARGTSASPSAVKTGDLLGAFTGQGYGATSYNYDETANISSGMQIYANQDYTDSAQGTYLTLSVIQNNQLNANVGLKVDSTGNVVIPATTISNSTYTGAFIVKGGVGVAGNLNVGQNLNVTSDANITGTLTASSLNVAGGGLNGVAIGQTTPAAGTFTTANATTFSGNIAPTTGLDTVYSTGHIVPTANITYDLGTTTNRFRSLYLSGSTIYLGNAVITTTTTGDLVINTNGSFAVPVGSTLQRSEIQGAIRYNTTISKFESFDGATWNTLAYGTVSDFPTGDFGDLAAVGVDPFGAKLANTFDCNQDGPPTYADLALTGEAIANPI